MDDLVDHRHGGGGHASDLRFNHPPIYPPHARFNQNLYTTSPVRCFNDDMSTGGGGVGGRYGAAGQPDVDNTNSFDLLSKSANISFREPPSDVYTNSNSVLNRKPLPTYSEMQQNRQRNQQTRLDSTIYTRDDVDFVPRESELRSSSKLIGVGEPAHVSFVQSQKQQFADQQRDNQQQQQQQHQQQHMQMQNQGNLKKMYKKSQSQEIERIQHRNANGKCTFFCFVLLQNVYVYASKRERFSCCTYMLCVLRS